MSEEFGHSEDCGDEGRCYVVEGCLGLITNWGISLFQRSIGRKCSYNEKLVLLYGVSWSLAWLSCFARTQPMTRTAIERRRAIAFTNGAKRVKLRHLASGLNCILICDFIASVIAYF